jgi:hypothetical protein
VILATEKDRDLAWRVLRQASGGDQSAASLVAATEDLLDRLSQRLGRIIGLVGYGALVRRATRITASQYTFLEDVTVEAQADGFTLRGLRASVLARDPVEARPCLVTLLATLIRLIVVLIDEDLAMRLIGQAWPELTGTTASPGFEERHP